MIKLLFPFLSLQLDVTGSENREDIPDLTLLVTEKRFVGSHGEGGTPGSIPNPEVKPFIADDTAYLCVGT